MIVAALAAIATVLFVCPLVLATGFGVVASAKRTLDEGLRLPLICDVAAHFWLFVGWPCDVLWNWTWGSLLLRDKPTQLTFSGHIQDLVDGPDGYSRDQAIWWALRLNAAMPDHIHRLP